MGKVNISNVREVLKEIYTEAENENALERLDKVSDEQLAKFDLSHDLGLDSLAIVGLVLKLEVMCGELPYEARYLCYDKKHFNVATLLEHC